MVFQIIQYSYFSPKNLLFSPLLSPVASPSCFSSSNYNSSARSYNNNERSVGLGSLKYDPLCRTFLISKRRQRSFKVVASSSGNVAAAPLWDTWSPDKATPNPTLSDVLWPSLGAFAGMAMLGRMDQLLAPKGLSMTIAPLGAVCAVLFITPKAPAARKYNMFMAQIGCAVIGVLAFTLLGPGWLSRSAALAACLAFMIYTKSTHPPAASLPLLFIDGAKFQGLNYWYALFPGAAGCIILSLLQEIVYYLKENFKF